jgi:hypothetical protein
MQGCHLVERRLRIEGDDRPLYVVSQWPEYVATLRAAWINDQWRICFAWSSGQATDVEIVDYHRG